MVTRRRFPYQLLASCKAPDFSVDGLLRRDSSSPGDGPHLPPRTEEALLLHGDGLDRADIAEKMGLPSRTVRLYLDDALRRLKRKTHDEAARKWREIRKTKPEDQPEA